MPDVTVLIVDDDQGITLGAELRLQAEGYRTLVARDGEQAVSVARDAQPDVILLDVLMPKLDGLAALKILRADERTRNIPIIMLSASLRDQHTALEAGARFFLTKPYRSAAVLEAIQAVLSAETAFSFTSREARHARNTHGSDSRRR